MLSCECNSCYYMSAIIFCNLCYYVSLINNNYMSVINII